jgi:hypothetical protein
MSLLIRGCARRSFVFVLAVTACSDATGDPSGGDDDDGGGPGPGDPDAPPPIPAPEGTDWLRLETGADIPGTLTFSALAWDSTRNQALAVTWEHEPWCLDVTTSAWDKCGDQGPQTVDFHNAGYAYDPVNDRHWVSTPTNKMAYWQRETGDYVEHSTGGIGMDPAVIYDPPRQRFLGFGGWSTTVGAHSVGTFALSPAAGSWTSKALPDGPDWHYPGDAAKMTFTRAGWDDQRQMVWYVHPDGVLWWLDPVDLTWSSQPTTGQKPEEAAVFGRHEARDTIVAWVGENYAVPAGFPIIGKTYVLEVTTGVWAELATATVPPPEIASAQSMMLYDPFGQRVLMHTGHNYGRETWALYLTEGE